MRSKLVLGSLFACAILIACSSSNNSTVLDDTDAGDDNTNTPGTTKKDSGTSTKDSGSKDRDSGTKVPDAGDGTGTAKVGDSCTADTDCAGSVASACTNGLSTDGTLYPAPFCVGPCNGDLTECDGPNTLCDDADNSGGICLMRCTTSTTAIKMACPAKSVCALLTLDEATGDGIGECLAACKTNSDCSGGDKCQIETGSCVKALATGTTAVGGACTDDKNCADLCQFPTGKTGYCTASCIVGDATTACPAGFACNVGADKTVFDGNPTGAQGKCWKTCATADDCGGAADAASWTCAEFGGGQKGCVPAE